MQKICVIVKLMFFYLVSFHLQANINTGHKTCKSMAMLGML